MRRLPKQILSGIALALTLAGVSSAQAPPPYGSEYPPYDSQYPTYEQQSPPPPRTPGRIGPGAPPGSTPSYPQAPRQYSDPSRTEVVIERGIHMSPVTPIAQGVEVSSAVLDQCQLHTMLPLLIAERYPEVVVSDVDGEMKLELTIVDIHAPGGGIFSGRKSVTTEGILYQGNTVIGTFVAKRSSMASTTACGMIANVIMVMASDIAQWLYDPTHDARLGEAR